MSVSIKLEKKQRCELRYENGKLKILDENGIELPTTSTNFTRSRKRASSDKKVEHLSR